MAAEVRDTEWGKEGALEERLGDRLPAQPEKEAEMGQGTGSSTTRGETDSGKDTAPQPTALLTPNMEVPSPHINHQFSSSLGTNWVSYNLIRF